MSPSSWMPSSSLPSPLDMANQEVLVCTRCSLWLHNDPQHPSCNIYSLLSFPAQNIHYAVSSKWGPISSPPHHTHSQHLRSLRAPNPFLPEGLPALHQIPPRITLIYHQTSVWLYVLKKTLGFPQTELWPPLHSLPPLILSLLSLPLAQSPTSVCLSVSLSHTRTSDVEGMSFSFLCCMLQSLIVCICYLISISSNLLQRPSYHHFKDETREKREVHQLQMELTLELKFTNFMSPPHTLTCWSDTLGTHSVFLQSLYPISGV